MLTATQNGSKMKEKKKTEIFISLFYHHPILNGNEGSHADFQNIGLTQCHIWM